MAKIFVTDKFHISPSVGLAHLNEALNLIADQIGQQAAFDLLRDNLPTIITDEGEQTSLIVNIVEGTTPGTTALEASIAEGVTVGSLAVVTLWNREAPIAQPTGEPLATPTALYLLALPAMQEMLTSAKVRGSVEKILSAAMLSAARKVAKSDAGGTAPLSRDRFQLILNATAKAGEAERAFTAIFPVLQAAILLSVSKKADALRNSGNTGAARNLEATFSKARLDKDTLKACLSSEAAAKIMFPAMPQSQWENMLKFAIAAAPMHKKRVAVKDPTTGKSAKDADGKVIYETFPDPQPTAIFQTWMETRSQQIADMDDNSTFTFEGLTV